MAESRKKPTHNAYSVRNYTANGGEQADWIKIGAAWLHKDGKGFDVTLDAVPLTGRIVLRLNVPREAKAD